MFRALETEAFCPELPSTLNPENVVGVRVWAPLARGWKRVVKGYPRDLPSLGFRALGFRVGLGIWDFGLS